MTQVAPSEDAPVRHRLQDQRCRPDRRAAWRGGRRDTDWLNRPPGALARATRLNRWWSWREWFRVDGQRAS